MGVLQGSILGPVVFNIFINYMHAGLRKLPDDAKLGGAANSLKSRGTLQRPQQTKDKCRILHLGNHDCLCRLGRKMLKSSTAERDLGVLVGGKLNMSQQRPGSQEGQPCSGGHQAQHGQLGKGGDCPALLCTGTASPQVLGTVLGTIV